MQKLKGATQYLDPRQRERRRPMHIGFIVHHHEAPHQLFGISNGLVVV